MLHGVEKLLLWSTRYHNLRRYAVPRPEFRTDGFEARRLLLKDRAFYEAHVSAMFKRIQDTTEMVWSKDP
jgi:hypothetical protein